MPVPVMRVREMCVYMRQRRMAMRVAMAAAGQHRMIVHVLMMRVVKMFVFMLHGLVIMAMQMPFGQMQPHAQHHQ